MCSLQQTVRNCSGPSRERPVSLGVVSVASATGCLGLLPTVPGMKGCALISLRRMWRMSAIRCLKGRDLD